MEALLEPREKAIACDGPLLERAACPQCGCTGQIPVLRGRDWAGSAMEFQVVRCMACDLRFTSPRPTEATIGRFYASDYRPHARPAKAERKLRGWYPHDWLTKPTEKTEPRLLDFGCGAGHFLASMLRDGWDVTGLDVSNQAVEAVRGRLGLNVHAGTLPHEALEPASFDMVTLWHALEHVHEPVRILREVRRLLAPGGRLVLAVPNFAGWQSRWFGPNWFGLELPRHITHFTATTLHRMLEQTGFRVLGLRHSRHADWVRASAQRARQAGQSSLAAYLLSFKKAASLAAWIGSRGREGDAILAWAEPGA